MSSRWHPHEHWHVDVSYINICGTFYYLCSALDGCSRSIVHWEIREQMKEADIETILERAKEKYPQARPRIISDNGPQFIARDFKEFIRISGMTHVRTSPFYPQSNGKLERWHQSLKRESIRPRCPLSLEDAREIAGQYVEHYNTRRLHSAIGYVAPADKMAGREPEIFAARDRKLEAARQQRQIKRQAARAALVADGEKPLLDKSNRALPESARPAKQKRALLKSNLPRDNGMRRRNKNVSTFWGGQKPPRKLSGRPLF